MYPSLGTIFGLTFATDPSKSLLSSSSRNVCFKNTIFPTYFDGRNGEYIVRLWQTVANVINNLRSSIMTLESYCLQISSHYNSKGVTVEPF